MTMNKRFKIVHLRDMEMYDIQDTIQPTPTFYNDLGSIYFSSAPQICELLNELDGENQRLRSALKNVCYTMFDGEL